MGRARRCAREGAASHAGAAWLNDARHAACHADAPRSLALLEDEGESPRGEALGYEPNGHFMRIDLVEDGRGINQDGGGDCLVLSRDLLA